MLAVSIASLALIPSRILCGGQWVKYTGPHTGFERISVCIYGSGLWRSDFLAGVSVVTRV